MINNSINKQNLNILYVIKGPKVHFPVRLVKSLSKESLFRLSIYLNRKLLFILNL